MKTLIKNAAQLITCKNGSFESLKNGACIYENSIITSVGTTEELEKQECENIIYADNCTVMPGFVDPHTHVVFAGTREKEFVMRIQGKSYLEILEQGGGIANSVRMTRAASEEELVNSALSHLDEMLAHGTTTVEIKSGYGLDTDTELKQLRVIKALREKHPIECAATFLGPHSKPVNNEFSSNMEFLKYMAESVLPQVKSENLAEFCDIFCEKGVFDVSESEYFMTEAKKAGFHLKMHADELNWLGGAELAAKLQMTSADHLLCASENGIRQMAEAGVCAVLLPGTLFFLMSDSYPDFEKFRKHSCITALATDFNPGSSHLKSMQLVISIACLQMRMTPEEAIVAATWNAAKAIRREKAIGSIEPGKQADIIILDAPDHNHIPYNLGTNLVNMTIKKGVIAYVKQDGVIRN